jgi:hypothetical protein
MGEIIYAFCKMNSNLCLYDQNTALILQYKQSDKRQDEPPEEVLGGSEEGLDWGAGFEEFGDGEHIKTECHYKNSGT